MIQNQMKIGIITVNKIFTIFVRLLCVNSNSWTCLALLVFNNFYSQVLIMMYFVGCTFVAKFFACAKIFPVYSTKIRIFLQTHKPCNIKRTLYSYCFIVFHYMISLFDTDPEFKCVLNLANQHLLVDRCYLKCFQL